MFQVIGERINTSRKLVQAAVAVRDADYIINDVREQQSAGADFIDVNAGARIGHEEADMLLGNDAFCMTYLKGVRSGQIQA